MTQGHLLIRIEVVLETVVDRVNAIRWRSSSTPATERDWPPMRRPTPPWCPVLNSEKTTECHVVGVLSPEVGQWAPHRQTFCHLRSPAPRLGLGVVAVRNLLYICGPNEVLVFAGGKSTLVETRGTAL